jgi:hypothetical protein
MDKGNLVEQRDGFFCGTSWKDFQDETEPFNHQGKIIGAYRPMTSFTYNPYIALGQAYDAHFASGTLPLVACITHPLSTEYGNELVNDRNMVLYEVLDRKGIAHLASFYQTIREQIPLTSRINLGSKESMEKVLMEALEIHEDRMKRSRSHVSDVVHRAIEELKRRTGSRKDGKK